MLSDTVFETERLLLRPLRIEDAGDIHSLTGDREVMRFENSGILSYDRTIDGLRRNLDILFPSMLPLGIRGAVLKDTGRLIGDCGLHRLENVEGNPVEITYHFTRAYWNQGYATEAAQCLVKHGFIALGLLEIVAAISPENVASARVAEKLGLRRHRKIEWPKQGLLDLYVITKDQYRSQQLDALDAEEYPA